MFVINYLGLEKQDEALLFYSNFVVGAKVWHMFVCMLMKISHFLNRSQVFFNLRRPLTLKNTV